MNSIDPPSQTLDQITTAYSALFKAKAFRLALRKLNIGRKLFPDFRDEHGHLYFQKEYIRTLLELKDERSAFIELNKGDYSPNDEHLILFARFYFTNKNFPLASLFYTRILANYPQNQEALSQVRLIDEKIRNECNLYINPQNICRSLDFIPSSKDRFKFYLGDYMYNSKRSGLFCKDDMENIVNFLSQDDLYHEVKNCRNTIDSLKDKSKISQVGKIYEGALLKRISQFSLGSKEFAFVRGDLPPFTPEIPFVFLTKAKQTFSKQFGTIIKCINKPRHWGEFEKLSKCNLPKFEDRMDKIVWRGATTGFLQDSESRFSFIEKFFDFNHDIYDVGFTQIVQSKEKWEKYLRESMSPLEMCRFKYILSIPGNDKDSGLNWKLSSGSVVIMPKPKSYSWLAEYFLLPGIHYIQIKSDFSDLPAVLEWCKKNQNECKRIAFNSKTYMSQFLNIKTEERLETKVLRRFFRE